MKKPKSNREGINPVIGVVLMIVVVVIISISVYMWTYKFTEEKQVEAPQEKILLESTEGNTAYIRNLSENDVIIDRIYINSKVDDVNILIPKGEVKKINFNAENGDKIQIVTEKGTKVIFHYIGEGTENVNMMPIADADGPYSVNEGSSIVLDGTGSNDPDGVITSYHWEITNDPTGAASLTNADTATPTFHAPFVSSDTDVEVELTVTDDNSATDTDTTTVTINNVPVCPHLYGWDGERYQFISSMIPNSILKRYESTYYHTADCLKLRDDHYDLILFEAVSEKAWINNVGLRVVDYPEDRKMVVSRSGEIYIVKNPQPVEGIDSYGNDVTSLLKEMDGKYWSSDLSTKDIQKELNDWIILKLPKPETPISEAKLLIAVRDSNLPDLALWSIMHYLLGTPNSEYVIHTLERETDLTSNFDNDFEDVLGIKIQYWNGTEWVTVNTVYPDSQQNPFDRVLQAVSLPLNKYGDNEIRILMTSGMTEIDYIAVDYSENVDINITDLQPVKAVKYSNSTRENVLNKIRKIDDSYALLEQGDYIHYTFDTSGLNPIEKGYARSFVAYVGGYYYITGPEVPKNKFYNLFWAENLVKSPDKFLQWLIVRYLHPENYSYRKYYYMDAVAPPFPIEDN